VASWEQVSRLALALPDASEHTVRGTRQWKVAGKLFVWERPLRPREVAELAERAPVGAILAARVEHLGAKEALLADDPSVFFTTSHFEGHPSVLARLELLAGPDLDELVTEAWLARAPVRVVRQFLDSAG
jgi:hypothetical protein